MTIRIGSDGLYTDYTITHLNIFIDRFLLLDLANDKPEDRLVQQLPVYNWSKINPLEFKRSLYAQFIVEKIRRYIADQDNLDEVLQEPDLD